MFKKFMVVCAVAIAVGAAAGFAMPEDMVTPAAVAPY